MKKGRRAQRTQKSKFMYFWELVFFAFGGGFRGAFVGDFHVD